MAQRIYLEAKQVEGSVFGHLYLVLRDDAKPDEAEVIRGGPEGPFYNPGELEIETMLLSSSQDAYDGGPIFSLDITDLVGGVGVWTDLKNFAQGLNGQYNYLALNTDIGGYTPNSNATILSVLNSVNVDVRMSVVRVFGTKGGLN